MYVCMYEGGIWYITHCTCMSSGYMFQLNFDVHFNMRVCVSVCVYERSRESVCVCVCERSREVFVCVCV